MAKKKTQIIGDLLSEITEDINTSASHSKKIPNIIEFCEGKEWLGLPSHLTNPIRLYPVQRIVLKTLYRGSIGNENLSLTDEEIELCKKLGLDSDEKGDLLDKYFKREIFRELVLVWGRRSSKDFVVSIIALYEAMKLLECPGGDPYTLYELASSASINILTIANSKDQARRAFEEIREKLLLSEYFKDKYTREGIGSSSIFLLTPQDKVENKKFREKGLPSKKGSIGIIVGHSNSDSLLGMGCIVLILDEVASYKASGGASSGDRIYTAMTPAVSTYCRRFYRKDEDGNVIVDEHDQKVVEKRIYDGKIISISSPRGQEGKFYDLFATANQVPHRLVCRLPTWEVNPTHTRESLRESQPTMSEAEFNMEFGAEFSGIGVENFFTEEQVNSCFTGHNLKDRNIGVPGNVYFIHLDPATSSHNYGLVVLHKEYYLNRETAKAEYVVIVDHIKHWSPVRGPINPEVVMDYVIGLKRRFHIGLLTYDQWASLESILKLRKASIPNKETRFNHSYKNIIYRELENLVNEGRIRIPYNHLLRAEMLELQRNFVDNGFKVTPKKEGDGVKSDDLTDCLAGAVYSSIERSASRLPKARTVETGVVSSGAHQSWNTMQGVTLYGSGQQVSNFLERRSSVPDNRSSTPRR